MVSSTKRPLTLGFDQAPPRYSTQIKTIIVNHVHKILLFPCKMKFQKVLFLLPLNLGKTKVLLILPMAASLLS